MKNKRPPRIGIEAGSLFGHMSGIGNYTYNLIKYLALIEKVDRFFVQYSASPLFRKSNLDFKSHNIIPQRIFIPALREKDLDVHHDACMAFPETSLKCKKIATIHDIGILLHPGWADDVRRINFERNIAKALKEYDAIITPSNSTRTDLVKYFSDGASKINVIREGIPEMFKPETKYQVSLVKARYSLKRPYILFVGTLEERKNIRTILEAYSHLRYEAPPELVLVGQTGQMKEPLQELLSRFSLRTNVRYLGYVPSKALPSLYSGAELLLCPTLHEGFCLPPMESIACATPVITSNISAAAEIYKDCAVLVDPEDPYQISKAMRELLSNQDLSLKLVNKGMEFLTGFSLKKMAQETLSLYRKLADS